MTKIEVNITGLEPLVEALNRLAVRLSPAAAPSAPVTAPEAPEPVITPEPSRDPETGSLDATAEEESIAETPAPAPKPAPEVEFDLSDHSRDNCIKILSAVGAKVGRRAVVDAIQNSTGVSALGDVPADKIGDLLVAVTGLVNG